MTRPPHTWEADNGPAERALADVPTWVLTTDAARRRNGAAPTLPRVIPTGQKHDTYVSAAGTLRRRGFSHEAAVAALLEENRQKAAEPAPAEHIEEIVASVYASYEAVNTIGVEAYTGPPAELADTVSVFTRWLHLPDVEPVYATLGAAAANYLPGAPVWLVLVGPPASGKTELLHALSRLPDVYQAATLTEASLLSGSPKREHASGAKGGLLRELGDFGLVVLKDMGSLLSMRPDAKAEILAALREVFDGAWTRYVGTDGGRALSWSGKVGLLAGATPVIDRHHGVLAAMGERFTLCRLAEADDEQAMRALEHYGEHEHAMRSELSTAVAALFSGRRDTPRTLDEQERQRLVSLAGLVTRSRSAVERDRVTREIEQVPGAEGPARLAITLERLLAGLDTLGCERELAWRVTHRVALDCVPALRRQLLEHLCEQGAPATTKAIAEAVDLPTNTVRRALEDLTAYGLASRYGQGEGRSDVWAATDWTRGRLRA